MTVRALAERLGTVWGRGAAARGEGRPQPGMSPGPLSQDQPFTHPPPAPPLHVASLGPIPRR